MNPTLGDIGILVGVALGTAGWIYTARRSRTISRKQHTVNIILQSNFNAEFRDSLRAIAPFLKEGKCGDLLKDENAGPKNSLRFVLNHYEFVASGIRYGDIDERLMYNCVRGSLVALWGGAQPYVYGLRNSRQRQAIYEHLEWLHKRWHTNRPGRLRRFGERCYGQPFPGKRVNLHD